MVRLTRRERQAQSRQALLKSALTEFANRGFHGASVEGIAENAGFTRGAFYSNFSSKEQIFLELFRQRTDERIEELRKVLRAPEDPVTGARAAGRQWTQLVSTDRSWVLLLLEFWAYAARTPDVREEFVRIDRQFTAEVARMIAEESKMSGAELSVPAETLATGMIGMAVGVALQTLADPERGRGDDVYEQMLTLIVRGARSSHSH